MDHVASRDDIGQSAVTASPGSLAQKGFIAADGNRIENEGETAPNLESGNTKMQAKFQVARVSRPLMSIGRICDQGHSVTFTKHEAVVRNPAGKIVCTFKRDAGLYLLEFRVKAPASAPFAGQSGRR